MIERVPAHEDCEDCTHIVEIPIPEGPKTLAQTKRDAMWDQIYGAALREMLKPPATLDLLVTRKELPSEESGHVVYKVQKENPQETTDVP